MNADTPRLPNGGAQWPVAPSQTRALVDPNAPLPVAYEQGGNVELNLATLWRILWEWRWLILSLLAVGIAGAVIVTLLTTPIYKSVATIELNPPRVQVMSDSNGGKGDEAEANDQQFVGTQLALLRSRALAERVVQDLNLAAESSVVRPGLDRTAAEQSAIGAVQSSLKVEVVPQSRVLTLSVLSRNPSLAAKIVNGVADGYINSTLERRYQSSSYARNFLERQISTVRRELENSERQLVDYAQQQRLISTGDTVAGATSDTNSLTGASLVQLNGALAAAEAKRFAAEQKYRESLSAGPTSEVSERTAGLRAQIAALSADYQQKLTTFRPDYPDMVRLKAQIDTLNAAIRDEARATRTASAGTAKQDFEAARGEETKLQQRVNELSGQVLDIRGRKIRYTILQRDVDTNRSLYDALLQRFKEIGVAGGIGAANASVVDRGRVPGAPYRPNLYFNLLIGSALGLALGIGGALMLEFVNDTIKTPEDVRDKLQLAFLGGVPSARGANPIEELNDSLSGISEGYFSLATSLQFTSETGIPKTLLVTSTRPAEGKSTSAWALAQSFTKLGKTVLLIDADMRRPAFIAGVEEEIGLSHLLTNTRPVRDSTLQTQTTGLWIVPSGPIPPNPPELLASPRLLQVLEEAASLFDVVVVDAPPILGLADAPLLSAAVKGTVMVVEAGRTRTRAAIDAHNRLRAANVHIIGAVLTRYRAQAAYGYGYGYGYGRKGDEAYSYKVDDKRRRRIQLTVSRDEEAGSDAPVA